MIDDEDDSDDRTSIEMQVPRLVPPGQQKRHPYFIVINGTTSVGRSFKLSGQMLIGRSAADITLEDNGISRRHAQVTVEPDGSVTVADLQSTNGTFFNGDRLEVRRLEDGDKVQFGNTTVLKLSYQDSLDEALQRNLYESATRDGLTKVYNKKFLLEVLEKEVAYAVRHQLPLALVMLDVDFFKKVNDTHGHPAGDYVLVKLSQVIQQVIRTEDVLARYGGEEFAVVLRQSGAAAAAVCAERIRSGVAAAEFSFNGVLIPVTISAGVASASDRLGQPQQLIEEADRLLYRAKQGGRNRVETATVGG
ncbi:MAG: GGDEF domain-containing protein [Myxococcota bacterium]|nr:GGDEF domain-containing protein [Myxococcota bacterium]